MMKAMNRVCLIAIATILVSGCASNSREPMDFARQPELKSGRSARGSNRKKAGPETPTILPETNYAAGRIFEQQGSPEKAIELYRKAIAANHDYTAAYARLGLMLSITGQHEESVAAFTRAVELKPTSAILRNNLGFELLYVERWTEAERHLQEATRLDAGLAQAHINLGLLLGRTQRDEQAVNSFRKVLPEPDAYYNIGLLQRAQGRHAQAVESFRHVLTINPEFNAAQRQLVQVERKIAAAETAKTAVTMNDAAVTDTGTVTEPSADTTTGQPVPPQTTSVPFVDLGALIKQMVSTPTQPHPATALPETENPTIADQDTAAKKETPAIRTTIGASIEPTAPVENLREVQVVLAPTAPANPQPVIFAQQTQPLRWDLTLSDMAHALKVADEQRQSASDQQAAPAPLGPLESQSEPVLASLMGPPTPSSDEVTLVLGTSETKPSELTTKLVSSTPALSPQAQKTIRTMDEMEISLQIIRNEIQCMNEFGASEAETSNTRGLGVPVEFTPIDPQSTYPDQRTQNWRNDFEDLDNVLAMIRNETACAHDVTLAQKNLAPSAPERTREEAEPSYQPGPVLQSPPTVTPRRARWGSRDKRSGR